LRLTFCQLAQWNGPEPVCGRLIDVTNAATVRYSNMIMQATHQPTNRCHWKGIGIAIGMGSEGDMAASPFGSPVVLVFPPLNCLQNQIKGPINQEYVNSLTRVCSTLFVH